MVIHASGAMACGFCGSRLISKGERGLECCGCGRPLLLSRGESGPALSWRQRLLALVVCVGALPLVGAIAATDQLRGGAVASGAALAVRNAAAAPEPPQLLQLQIKEQQQAEAHADQQIVATERRGAEEAR